MRERDGGGGNPGLAVFPGVTSSCLRGSLFRKSSSPGRMIRCNFILLPKLPCLVTGSQLAFTSASRRNVRKFGRRYILKGFQMTRYCAHKLRENGRVGELVAGEVAHAELMRYSLRYIPRRSCILAQLMIQQAADLRCVLRRYSAIERCVGSNPTSLMHVSLFFAHLHLFKLFVGHSELELETPL